VIVLLWLAVPAAATVLSIVWVHWSSRSRGPVGIYDSLAERERFKAAFAPPSRPRHRVS
jgi:hypothetical protein